MRTGPYKVSAYNIDVPLEGGGKALIFNTLSRAFAVLDPAERDFLSAVNVDAELEEPRQIELFDRLLLNGYVVPNDIDELGRLQESYSAARNDGSTLMLTIAPTLFCNFGCDYCFQGADKPRGKMDEQVMDRLVAYVEQQVPRGKAFHVSWYGGEPLLALDVIERLSERFIGICEAQGASYSAAIITNGHGLTAKVAAKLQRCRVNVVQITLDGASEFHDERRHLLNHKPTFRRIVDNIASFIDTAKFSIHLRVNIDERNRGSIFGLIDSLAELSLGGKTLSMYFAPVEATTSGCSQVSDVTMTKSEYAELETALFRYAHERKLASFPFPPRFMGLCGAVRPRALVVTPTGDLHKCWDTVTFEHQKVGNLSDVAAVANHPVNQLWSQWSPFENSSCRNCKVLPTCAGACAYKFVHWTETSGEAAVLPCPSWKFNIKDNLLRLAQLRGHITEEQIPAGVATVPHELCSFEPPTEAQGLPAKIVATKRASYDAAGRRSLPLAVF
jgi:uncharacterized protein